MNKRIFNSSFSLFVLAVIASGIAMSLAGHALNSNSFSEEKTESFVLFENTGFDSDVYIEINDSEDLTDKKCFTLSHAIPGFVSEGIPTIRFIKEDDSVPRETYFLIMHNLPPPLA